MDVSPGFILLAILVAILFIWIRWRMNKTNFFRKYGIPGPPSHFLTGNLISILKIKNKCIEEWIGKYGKIFGFFLGGIPCIVCVDVNLIKLMRIKEFKKFANRGLIIPDGGISDPTFHNSAFVKKDEEWRESRNVLSTSFTTGKIKSMTTLLSKPISHMIRNIDKKNGEPFNVIDMVNKLSFDIACITEFGLETNVQDEESNKFIKSLFSFLKIGSNDITVAVSVLFPELEPIPCKLRSAFDVIKYKLNLPCDRVVFETCRKILHSRKTSNIRHVDLIQSMIDAKDESGHEFKIFSEDCIIANIASFLLAGIEGITNLTCWCIYYISVHQEIQEKMREEITNNTEKYEVQYSDLINLKYMDQVLAETLRFLPISILAVNRVCKEDFKYEDMIIPKNVPILVPLQVLNKDPVYWDNPNKFDPERFSPSNIGKIDNIIYQPFGVGPRNCLGKKLGRTYIKMILATLIKSYRFELHGEEETEITYYIFVSNPKNGINVRAFPISS